jgi:hypothetical protein
MTMLAVAELLATCMSTHIIHSITFWYKQNCFCFLFIKKCVKFSRRKKYDNMLSANTMLSDNMLPDNMGHRSGPGPGQLGLDREGVLAGASQGNNIF